LRYVAFSYSASLTERDNMRFRDLVSSARYQELYGHKVKLRNKTTTKVINTGTGWKLASSVGGIGTGERGDRVIIDDPHNVVEGESEVIRVETVRWFRESISSRFNRLDSGALIVIMQRVHEEDVSGVILQLKQEGLDYCHLMIPWEFDPSRSVPNEIGWIDPRHDEDNVDANAGEPAWSDRFHVEHMRQLRIALGPYAWASQYQQSPAPRGGGIFQRDWWQTWESPDNKFPPFEYIIASLDSAFTEKEENDPSGFTVWGVFLNEEKRRRIMLVHAWRKHLPFSADRGLITPRSDEDDTQNMILVGDRHITNPRYQRWRRRTMEHWGLMEWVNDTCNRYKVDKLLIEAKASGISAAQELQNRFGRQDWVVELYPVKGDKIARAYAVQPTFSQLMVYAPVLDWSEMVIDEMAVFPKGKHDDLTDSACQAIKYMRDIGLAWTDEEAFAAEMDRVTHRSGNRATPIYPV
jgi:predicted phage terminase large subunit-like protein